MSEKQLRRQRKPRECDHLRGWDWTELAMVFDAPLIDDEHFALSLIRIKLRDLRMEVDRENWDEKFQQNPVQRKQIRQIRHFLRLCGKKTHGYEGPVYLGMAAIKNDGVMLAWVDHFLEWLWT